MQQKSRYVVRSLMYYTVQQNMMYWVLAILYHTYSTLHYTVLYFSLPQITRLDSSLLYHAMLSYYTKICCTLCSNWTTFFPLLPYITSFFLSFLCYFVTLLYFSSSPTYLIYYPLLSSLSPFLIPLSLSLSLSLSPSLSLSLPPSPTLHLTGNAFVLVWRLGDEEALLANQGGRPVPIRKISAFETGGENWSIVYHVKTDQLPCWCNVFFY